MKKTILKLGFLATISFVVSDKDVEMINAVLEQETAQEWIQKAWVGKADAASKRIIKAETDLSIKGNETLPAGKQAIIDKYLNRSEIKSKIKLKIDKSK